MGDFRVLIEAVGNHGCGREAPSGTEVKRCGSPGCTDCIIIEAVEKLKKCGSVSMALIQHWPVPGAGCGRDANPGPIDNILTGKRDRRF
jgi:hypothetical protein